MLFRAATRNLSRFPRFALLASALSLALFSGAAPSAQAANVSVPVLDLSGVWIATVPGSAGSPRLIRPPILFTLTLQRIGAQVASNGASVDISYSARLYIDGYIAKDLTPETNDDPIPTLPCRRQFIDRPEDQRNARSTSMLVNVNLGFESGYSVGMFLV